MKKVVKLTPDQAAEVAVQGMFAKADRDRAERFKRAGKLDAAKKASDRANARIHSLKDRYEQA